MEKFYFTFGFGQEHQNCFTIIEAEDWFAARVIMVERYGLKWSFQYSEEKWHDRDGVSQQERYGLTEI